MEAHNNLGNVLKNQACSAKPLPIRALQLRLKPDSAKVLINLGIVYRKADSAQRQLMLSIQHSKPNTVLAVPHLQLALIYLSGEKIPEGAAALKKDFCAGPVLTAG